MEKHIVSFSGGKDSTAMLLLMLEKGMQVDEIIFCDTTVEFPEMYEHIKKVEKYIGRPITILKAEHSYEYMLLDHQKTRGQYKGEKGYDWTGPRYRWCTRYLKQDVVKKYKKEKYKNQEIIEYLGIAFDELNRVKDIKNTKYPLVEWEITERMALDYCYSKGFTWGGLYRKVDRVSCWCCPLQNLKSLRNLYDNFPHLWKILKDWDSRTRRKFRADYSVEELEKKFKKEYKQKKLF